MLVIDGKYVDNFLYGFKEKGKKVIGNQSFFFFLQQCGPWNSKAVCEMLEMRESWDLVSIQDFLYSRLGKVLDVINRQIMWALIVGENNNNWAIPSPSPFHWWR